MGHRFNGPVTPAQLARDWTAALQEHAERERVASIHTQHRTVLYMKGRQS